MPGEPKMQAFTYHAAPLSRSMIVTVSEESVSDGATTLIWADIVHLRHVSRRFRRVRLEYFDLTGRDGSMIRLACSGPFGRWGQDDNSAVFITLIGAIVQTLARRRPELNVSIDDAAGWRWAWFALGCVTALLGAGVCAFAIHDGVELDRLLAVLPVMGLLAVFGAAIAWSNRPWRPERTSSIQRYCE